ncbi:MAG: tetratricopeptide repeat protein [Flavobacteriales bacterium]|nr:tetratricopeptide repeat protein [Flavobacteriales bacterium]
MKNIFCVFLFIISLNVVAQKYADTSYYLVDSLSLDDLSKGDVKLLDSCLKVYHASKQDTSRIKTLTFLIEEMVSNDWKKYQFYQYEQLQALLKNNPSIKVTNALQLDLAGAIGNIGYIYSIQGQVKEALDYFNRSLKIEQEIDDKEGVASSLNHIGLIYNNQGKVKEAVDYYSRSLKIREEIGDEKGIALSLNNIGTIYNDKGQVKEALVYYNRSLKIYEDLDDKEGVALSLNNIGLIYNDQGKIKEALDYYDRSLKIRDEIGDKKGVAFSLNNIASLYASQGKTKEALACYDSSLKILEEIGNKAGIASSLNNIGAIYNTQGQQEEALDYYTRSLKIRKELGAKEGIAISLNNIGYIYKDQGQLKEALDYFSRSLKILEEIGFKAGIATSLNNNGYIYDKLGKIKEALDYYNRSLKMQEELGNKAGIALSLINIGNIYDDQGQLNKALAFGKKSLTISKEIGSPDRIKASSRLLCNVYEKQGNGMKSLEMYKLYVIMKDSMSNAETQKATAQQQAKYTYEKQKTIDDAAREKQKALDGAEKDKLIAIEKEKKETQQVISGAILLGLILVVVFLLFVFNRLRVAKKQQKIIEQQKEAVEHAHDELEVKNQEIMDSINYAKRIQSAILPPAKLVKEYLKESFILYIPKDVVAGDFYWMEQTSGKVFFAAADCTGHGVPGAMVSVICNNALNRSVREHGLSKPGDILNKTREIVVEEFDQSEEEVKDGMDIALCSIEGMKLEYAGAHNPLWIIRNGEIIETKANKQPVGKFDNPKPYKTHSFDLKQGDTIYIFSDGYVDQFGGEKGKKFKSKTFRDLLLSIQEKAMEEQKKSIESTFQTWRGDLEQLDDVCIIGVKV